MSDTPEVASPLAPQGASPLVEADPNSINTLIQERIDEVFNTLPTAKDEAGNYLLTDAKLTLMVEYYRKQRAHFLIESQQKEDKAASKGPRKATPKSVAAAIAATEDLL